MISAPFALVAKRRGPWWQLQDEEAMQLAAAVQGVLPYLPQLPEEKVAKYAAFGALAMTTASVLGPRVSLDKQAKDAVPEVPATEPAWAPSSSESRTPADAYVPAREESVPGAPGGLNLHGLRFGIDGLHPEPGDLDALAAQLAAQGATVQQGGTIPPQGDPVAV